ncbi:hypothetical protein JCGZ_01658 [Jatropha curcas]|uniref:Uncharacterized protein n=1 Tax=Jatropha curcas TaxID=180498 RepID=A0A067JGA9_JATCU|nr:hypothetical protein JCGZ_01658 [Jatropha curcas]
MRATIKSRLSGAQLQEAILLELSTCAGPEACWRGGGGAIQWSKVCWSCSRPAMARQGGGGAVSRQSGAGDCAALRGLARMAVAGGAVAMSSGSEERRWRANVVARVAAVSLGTQAQ